MDRAHWSNATPIRGIFKEAFARACLPYFNPHSFRNTLVALGEKLCQSPEEFKAWSQNLGHEGVLTTFLSYGAVATSQQGEIIRNMGSTKSTSSESLKTLMQKLQRPEVLLALSAIGDD